MCIKNTPHISDLSEKLLYIGKVISTLISSPKGTSPLFCKVHTRCYESSAVGGRYGWRSTLEVLNSIKYLVCKTKAGQSRWKNYILSEASTLFLLLISDFVLTALYHTDILRLFVLVSPLHIGTRNSNS
ncbi:hypothetical protein PSTT_11421 [Puccinia striiformis]|uniref:Uncharacterized protein n=1 Tax=Puccinia striiformis TaxID=27350 RepID=A0A2S4V0B9_9BASI|nr:hypothetical protein PSTT_11421 [Puccinia striiformis]